MSVKTTTKGSRIRILGFGYKKYNGYYTSFSCDKSTRPTVDTYDKYVYTHTSGGASLKIYKDGSRYYWGIFEGSSLKYKRIINNGVHNINLLSFPWEDSHIPWTYGGSVTSLAYFNIEYCGEMSKEYGNIYSDMFTATITDASGTSDYCFKKKTNIASAHPFSSDVWACNQNNETKLVCLLNFETSTSVGSVFKDDTGNCTVEQLNQTNHYSNNSRYPSKFGSGCIHTNYFNESEAGLVISDVPRLDAFTIEFWCRYFGDADKENLNQTWGGIIVRDIGTGEYLMSYPFTDIIKDTYYHHAFVRESGSFIVHEYINGVEVAQSMFTGCFGGDFQLSTGGWQVKDIYKTMDGLAIWNYAKYNGTFTPQSSAYVASDYSTNITDPSYKYEIKWSTKESDNEPCLLFTRKMYGGEATESDCNGLYTYEGEFNNKPYYSNGTYYILYRPCTDTNSIYNYGWLLTRINGGTPESSLNNIYIYSYLCDGYTHSAGRFTENADAVYEYPWSANWYNDMLYEYEIAPLNGDGCWSLFKDGEEIGYFGEMIYPPIPKLFPWEGSSSDDVVLHLIKEGSIDSIKFDANGCRYVLDGSSCPLEGCSFSCLEGSDVAKCDSKSAFFVMNGKPSTIFKDTVYSSYNSVLYYDTNNAVYAYGPGTVDSSNNVNVTNNSASYNVAGNFRMYSANNVSIENVGEGGSGSGDNDITTYNYSELDTNGDAKVDSDQLSKLFVPVGEKVRIKTRFASPDKDTIYIRIMAIGSNLGLEGPMEDNLRLLTEDGTVKYTSYQFMPEQHEILENNLPNGNYYIELDNTDGTEQISMSRFDFNAYGDATGISDWVESGESGGGSGESSDDWHYLTVSGFDANTDGTYELTSGDGSDGVFSDCQWTKQGGGRRLYCIATMEWLFDDGAGNVTYNALWVDGGRPWECDWGDGRSIKLGSSGESGGSGGSQASQLTFTLSGSQWNNSVLNGEYVETENSKTARNGSFDNCTIYAANKDNSDYTIQIQIGDSTSSSFGTGIKACYVSAPMGIVYEVSSMFGYILFNYNDEGDSVSLTLTSNDSTLNSTAAFQALKTLFLNQ